MKNTDENHLKEAEKYSAFYDTSIGVEILRKETEYIRSWLSNCETIIDVGCGPGVFERELSDLNVIGVDSSPEMIKIAKRKSKAEFKVAQAESLAFPDERFDGVFFISALSFIGDYQKAIDEAARVLMPGGRIVALMCNTRSNYFKEKLEKGGYTIIDYLSERFNMGGEYMIGVKNGRIVDTDDPKLASIYALKGTVRSGGD